MKRVVKRKPEAIARAAELVAHRSITKATACDGKQAYASQNDARHAAKELAKRAERDTTTYRCPFCKSYHVTKLEYGEECA